MTSSGAPITQIAEYSLYQDFGQDNRIKEKNLLSKQVRLKLRDERIDIDLETLILLPDSFTLSMFPNGLGLQHFINGSTALFDEIHSIDLDPVQFKYMKSFFEKARHISLEQQPSLTTINIPLGLDSNSTNDAIVTSILIGNKQLVIVLREELDYFILPQPAPDNSITDNRQKLKTHAGNYLVQENKIFDALIRNIEKENNTAEQHLITMLCEAGFDYDDHWAYRALDPKRTYVTSLSLCRLGATGSNKRVDIIQRFMLFWKKPARKCWWDVEQLKLDNTSIRLWKRRTFWLELATA